MDTTSDVKDAIRTKLLGRKIGSSYVDERLSDGDLTAENGSFSYTDSSGLHLSSGNGKQLARAAADHIAATAPEEQRNLAEKEELADLENKKRDSGEYRPL